MKSDSKKGLLRSLSVSNVSSNSQPSFMKRLSESFVSPSKKAKFDKVSSIFGEICPPKSLLLPEGELKGTLTVKSQENNLFLKSDTKVRDFGEECNKQFTERKQNNSVSIDEDDNENLNQKTIIRSMLKDEVISKKLPVRRQWSSASTSKDIKSKNSVTSKLCESPIKETAAERAEEIQTAIGNTEIPDYVHIPRPNKYLSSSLRRVSSFSLKNLPTNRDDFLTKAEQEKFSSLINTGTVGDELLLASSQNDHDESWFDDDLKFTSAKTAAMNPEFVAECDQEFVPNTKEELEVELESPSEPEKRSNRKGKSKKEKVPIKMPKKATTQASIELGANSNQNYRAMKLKGKGFKQGSKNKSSGRFSKTSKLSSYNDYKIRDPALVTAGYSESVEGEIEVEVEPLAKVDDIKVNSDIFVPVESDGECVGEVANSYHESNEVVKVDLLKAIKELTGFSEFRKGQLEVTKRILAAKSSLLVLPTAGGKSLCYQLPAFIIRNTRKTFHSMVLVISPTISLIKDQIMCLPVKLRGACISNSLTMVVVV